MSTKNYAVIENSLVKIIFNQKKGVYTIIDKQKNQVHGKELFFQIDKYRSNADFKFTSQTSNISTNMGNAIELELWGTKSNAPRIGLKMAIYEDSGIITFENSIIANCNMQIRSFSPISGQVFASHYKIEGYATLGGDSGNENTIVKHGTKDSSLNNMLITFGKKNHPKHSLVFGGLSYNEFIKSVSTERKKQGIFIKTKAEDPYGKRVDKNSLYSFSEDKFYLNFTEDNRFKALENYAFALKKANNVELDDFTYASLNFWYCFTKQWGGDYFSNNSNGTIKALKRAKEVGFLRYGPLGIRLEPDDYAEPNNQQGWWDDEHFRIYESGQLLPPLDSIEKWGKSVRDNGGIPLIYCQTARRSQDYAEKYPEHMLFNQSYAPLRKPPTKYWIQNEYEAYDFTDPEFSLHMEEVYKNLKKGNLAGIKFDYPEMGWASAGGFEDKYATTTSAYRKIYKFAYDGLGHNSDIHERIPCHGDIALGCITTHRTEDDTDRFWPIFARKNGLRWYKNRVVTKYINDVINPEHAFPYNQDGWRTMYTMSYLTNARIEIGKYIENMSEAQRQDLTKIIPLYNLERSAKPIDAFENIEYPQIFDLKISDNWHQVALYNSSIEGDFNRAYTIYKELPKEKKYHEVIEYFERDKNRKITFTNRWPEETFGERAPAFVAPIPATIKLFLGAKDDDGGLGLESLANYYIYDFWNNQFVGKFAGDSIISQELRMGETRMLAIHKVESSPQFISTDRHILQGFVDFKKVPEWSNDNNSLTGESSIIEDEPYKIIIALNNFEPLNATSSHGNIAMNIIDNQNQLLELTITSAKTIDIEWTIKFKTEK